MADAIPWDALPQDVPTRQNSRILLTANQADNYGATTDGKLRWSRPSGFCKNAALWKLSAARVPLTTSATGSSAITPPSGVAGPGGAVVLGYNLVGIVNVGYVTTNGIIENSFAGTNLNPFPALQVAVSSDPVDVYAQWSTYLTNYLNAAVQQAANNQGVISAGQYTVTISPSGYVMCYWTFTAGAIVGTGATMNMQIRDPVGASVNDTNLCAFFGLPNAGGAQRGIAWQATISAKTYVAGVGVTMGLPSGGLASATPTIAWAPITLQVTGAIAYQTYYVSCSLVSYSTYEAVTKDQEASSSERTISLSSNLNSAIDWSSDSTEDMLPFSGPEQISRISIGLSDNAGNTIAIPGAAVFEILLTSVIANMAGAPRSAQAAGNKRIRAA